jgi:glycosyltransferase involved in cell wall biosynthesis
VEIGMPTRSGGPYLAQALDSVLAQTFRDWRLTVAENGPGSRELAEALAPYLEDGRIRHVVRGVDLGPEGNHNALLREFRAEYVAFLHDDDYWAPPFLERRVEFLDREPACAFVFGAFDTVDESGAVLATRRGALPPGRNEPATFVPAMLRANLVGMPTLLARRRAYEAVGPAFRDDFPMNDYEMWIRIGARHPIGYLDDPDASWRFHRRQRSARLANWGESWLRFYDAVDRTLADVDGIPVDGEHLRRQRAAAHLCAALDAVEAREPARARRHAGLAVATRSAARRDPRYALSLVCARLGGPGARALGALRGAVKRARGELGPRAARLRTASHRL